MKKLFFTLLLCTSCATPQFYFSYTEVYSAQEATSLSKNHAVNAAQTKSSDLDLNSTKCISVYEKDGHPVYVMQTPHIFYESLFSQSDSARGEYSEVSGLLKGECYVKYNPKRDEYELSWNQNGEKVSVVIDGSVIKTRANFEKMLSNFPQYMIQSAIVDDNIVNKFPEYKGRVSIPIYR